MARTDFSTVRHPKPIKLYFVASPLHLLVATAIALRQKERYQAKLVLIDEKIHQPERYMQALQSWSASPFDDYQHLASFAPSLLSPNQEIRRRLRKLIEHYRPIEIITGNDRRMEFQYAMHQANRLQLSCIGAYMDEGIFSYVARLPEHPNYSRRLKSLYKKLSLGPWWENPNQVGHSSQVKKAYVFFPELLKPRPNKILELLTPDYFTNPEFKQFCQTVMQQYKLDKQNLEPLRQLLILPHVSPAPDQRDIVSELKCYFQQQTGNTAAIFFDQLAIKDHPRNDGSLAQQLKQNLGIQQDIPQQIPVEVLVLSLPQLNIIGYPSTALLNAKLLNPSIQVSCIGQLTLRHYEDVEPVFSAANIHLYDPAQTHPENQLPLSDSLDNSNSLYKSDNPAPAGQVDQSESNPDNPSADSIVKTAENDAEQDGLH